MMLHALLTVYNWSFWWESIETNNGCMCSQGYLCTVVQPVRTTIFSPLTEMGSMNGYFSHHPSPLGSVLSFQESMERSI